MEAFFAQLKVELIYPENYRTLDELRMGLFEYIESSATDSACIPLLGMTTQCTMKYYSNE